MNKKAKTKAQKANEDANLDEALDEPTTGQGRAARVQRNGRLHGLVNLDIVRRGLVTPTGRLSTMPPMTARS